MKKKISWHCPFSLPFNPLQRCHGQNLSLFFWNFLTSTKIIDKFCRNIEFFIVTHPEVVKDIFLIFSYVKHVLLSLAILIRVKIPFDLKKGWFKVWYRCATLFCLFSYFCVHTWCCTFNRIHHSLIVGVPSISSLLGWGLSGKNLPWVPSR